MKYKYAGYIATLLERPDPELRDQLEHVEFSADDFVDWNLVDDEADSEWKVIPASGSP